MRKNRHDVCRWRMIILRPASQSEGVFLTVYTVKLDQKMRGLIRRAIRARYARQVDEMLKDAPPDVKGTLLLQRWDFEERRGRDE